MDPETGFSRSFLLTEQERKMEQCSESSTNISYPRRNVIYVHAQFHKSDQRSKETVERYITALYELTKDTLGRS